MASLSVRPGTLVKPGAAEAQLGCRSKRNSRRQAPDPALHTKSISHIESQQRDIRGPRGELERVHRMEAGHLDQWLSRPCCTSLRSGDADTGDRDLLEQMRGTDGG